MQMRHAVLACAGLGILGALAAIWRSPASQRLRFEIWRPAPFSGDLSTQKPKSSAFRCQPMTTQQRIEAAFGNLDGYTHKIATRSSNAQRLFDQGMMLAFGFNQNEALRSFSMASAEDPGAAAPYWGIAYASGPYLNKATGSAEEAKRGGYPVFSQKELEAGRAAVHKGLLIAHEQLQALGGANNLGNEQQEYLKALERDKAYLGGIAKVYDSRATYGPAFEAGVHQYARGLQEWASAHPEDKDALALAAEALANLQPWDFWDDSQPPQPKPGTLGILGVTRAALDRSPTHPLALHLMIHGTEASAAGPEGAGQGLPAAGQLSSNFIGHLQHMPSHTYLRTGYWSRGVKANEGAYAIDASLAARCVEPYSPYHNTQMLMYMAMTGGMLEKAEEWGALYKEFPAIFGPTYVTDGRDHLMLPLAWLRFGRWQRLMELQPAELDPTLDGVNVSPQASPFSKAMFHVMRSFAHAALAVQEEQFQPTVAPQPQQEKQGAKRRAFKELNAAEAVAASLVPDQVTKPGQGLGVYSSAFKAMSMHAILMLRARLAVLEGDLTKAALHLESAQEVDDKSGYMEPPRFYQPALECLGWTLLQDGKVNQAAVAYMQALQEYPRSPWALTGLRDVLKSGSTGAQQQQQQQQQQQVGGVTTAQQHSQHMQDPTSDASTKHSLSEAARLNKQADLGVGKGQHGTHQRLMALGDEPAAGKSGAVGIGSIQTSKDAEHAENEGGGSFSEEGAQNHGSQSKGGLPAGIPSLEQVEALLLELAAEAEGGAVTLPSSCPSFSEAWQ